MLGRLIDNKMGIDRFRSAPVKAIAAATRRVRIPGVVRLTERIHRPKPGHGIEMMVSLANGIQMHVDTSNFIERRMFFEGSYEPEVGDVITSHLTPFSVAIDVGANIGLHAISMAKTAHLGTVVACEPHPVSRSRLLRNLTLNGVNNVRILEFAIGAADGRTPLHSPDDVSNLGMTSLLPLGDWKSIEVDMRRVDDLVDSERLERVDLIKIDVEGLEGAVLAGAQKTLVEHRPVLIFEYEDDLWTLAGYDLETELFQLQGLGYNSFSVVGRDGRRPVDEIGPSGNVLAVNSAR